MARGDCDERGLERIHAELRRLLEEDRARLDAIYYCPHHPDFTGICGCRKPAPGMVLRAQSDFNIDLRSSWIIGDSVKDIRLARKVGARAALVRTGKAGSDAEPGDDPDGVFYSLSEAVDFITGTASPERSIH